MDKLAIVLTSLNVLELVRGLRMMEGVWSYRPLPKEDDGRTAIGLKLDPERSQMLVELREWLTSQEIVEFAGSKTSGLEASKTSTTVARWLLESAIDALYADLLLDGLIDKAADLWAEDLQTSDKIWRSEEGYPNENIDEEFVKRILLEEGHVSGFPADIVPSLVLEGKARWKKRGAKAKIKGPVSGELLAARFKERFLQETEETSEKIELY